MQRETVMRHETVMQRETVMQLLTDGGQNENADL